MEKHDKNLLQRIVGYLLINSSFTNNQGLFHGKMGIVLFFCHYARYSGNSDYDDFAGELMEEIYEDINTSMSIDFESGLSGIGWGCLYLFNRGFMKGDINETLADIDLRIMEQDPARIKDFSFRKGLGGISHYVCCRLNANLLSGKEPPFDQSYLKNLFSSISNNELNVDSDMPEGVPERLGKLLNGDAIKEEMLLPELLFRELPELTPAVRLGELLMGIEKGIAGTGLKLIGI